MHLIRGINLRFSETVDGTNNSGTEYTTGIVFIGTPGEEGAATQFSVSDETASSLIYIIAKLLLVWVMKL